MGLLDKARDLLKGFRAPPPPRDRTDAVAADEFDYEMFERVKGEAPVLDEVIHDLNEHFDHTDDLMRDVMLSLWQKEPEVRPKREMKESHVLNRAVSEAIQDSPEVQHARSYTIHDDYSACIAATGVAGTVEKTLREFREQAEQSQQQAEQARQGKQQAGDGLAAAMDGAPGDDGELTPEQQQAIEQAMQDYLDAAQADADAQQQMDDLSQQVTNSVGNATDAALNEAAEDLADEQRLMQMWGVGPGELQKMSFEERAELADLLRNTRMAKFSQLVGRFKLMAAAQQAKKVVEGRDDVVDVDTSNDMSRVLLSELAQAEAHPTMMLNFQRRFAEGMLLSRAYEGVEHVGNGPVVCALDSSTSMSREYMGVTREAWSKAFALALLDEAMRLNREFHGINFASANVINEFHTKRGDRDVHGLLNFIETFHRGGTNFDTPLRAAVEAIEGAFGNSQRADIVFVTDGECRMSPEFIEWFADKREELDFRVFGVCIGDASGFATLQTFCDNVRTIHDLTDPETVKDIFRSLSR